MNTNNRIFADEKNEFLEDFNKKYKNELEEIENLHKTIIKKHKKQNIPFQIIGVVVSCVLVYCNYSKAIIYTFLAILVIVWIAVSIKTIHQKEYKILNKINELIFNYVGNNICNIKMIDCEENCKEEDSIYFKHQNKAIELIKNTKLFENFNSIIIDGIYVGKYKNIDFEFYNCEITSKEEDFTGIVYYIKCESKYKNITFSKQSNAFNIPKELTELLKEVESEKTLKHYFDKDGNLVACLNSQAYNSGFTDSSANDVRVETLLFDTYLTEILFAKKIIDILKP